MRQGVTGVGTRTPRPSRCWLATEAGKPQTLHHSALLVVRDCICCSLIRLLAVYRSCATASTASPRGTGIQRLCFRARGRCSHWTVAFHLSGDFSLLCTYFILTILPGHVGRKGHRESAAPALSHPHDPSPRLVAGVAAEAICCHFRHVGVVQVRPEHVVCRSRARLAAHAWGASMATTLLRRAKHTWGAVEALLADALIVGSAARVVARPCAAESLRIGRADRLAGRRTPPPLV
jgi:hypothetical protein